MQTKRNQITPLCTAPLHVEGISERHGTGSDGLGGEEGALHAGDWRVRATGILCKVDWNWGKMGRINGEWEMGIGW